MAGKGSSKQVLKLPLHTLPPVEVPFSLGNCFFVPRKEANAIPYVEEIGDLHARERYLF